MLPHTDIIIGIRGTRQFPIEKDFEVCVEGLVKHTQRFRLILVDDASDAEARAVIERVAAQFPTAVLIRTFTQNWFTRAYNKGLRLVRTPWAVALNADTVIGPGWLEEMFGVRDEVEATGLKVGLVGSVWSPGEPRRFKCTIHGRDYVTGHCLLMSMEAIARAAENRGMPGWYLDETNHLNAHVRSDVELCWRLNTIGYQTVISYKSEVGHLGGRSWGHQLGPVWNLTQEQLSRIDGS